MTQGKFLEDIQKQIINKISTSTNLQEQSKTSILQKKYQQNFNDQTPHQLVKQDQHNSEESIKMSKE